MVILSQINFPCILAIFVFSGLCLGISHKGLSSELPLIKRFEKIYEPSGVVYHPSGKLLIVEDRKGAPLYIIGFSGELNSKTWRLEQTTQFELNEKTEDLEGIALGRDDSVFLITSFSSNKKGKRKTNRQRLILLKMVDGKVVQQQYYDSLLPELTRFLTRDKYFGKSDIDALNIEAISFDKDKARLVIGLRSPLKEGKSILLILENPYEIFMGNEPPVFSSQIIELDLGGGGVRAMTYDQSLQMYLIANEVENKKGKLRPGLWQWDGNAAHKPSKVSLPKMKGVKNIEGITPVLVNNKKYLLLVCDDGDRKEKEGAHYILLDYSMLKR